MNTNYPFMVEFTGSPEAGKTTCINTLLQRFSDCGLKVKYIQESAEIISCSSIPKKSFDAHISMRLLSIINILKAKYENYDLVLIDRGLIDGIFYTIKFLADNTDNYDECSRLINLLDCLKSSISPDLLVIFKVSPEISIKRKGHEGTIVNLSFCKEYNRLLDSFLTSLESPYTVVDTSNLSKEEVSNIVFNKITDKLHRKAPV